MEYILEMKQIVDFPRVRIHRELIQSLLADKTLSMRGTSYLFQFMVLCSYANFRSSRKRIGGQTYCIGPGQWICDLHEMRDWFRLERLKDVVNILDYLGEHKLLSYERLPGTQMIYYKILHWEKFNTVLEYECRCPKNSGFFFFPIKYSKKLIKERRCSELDAIMDMWLNTIYMDERVKGSDLGPVVYFRNESGNPRTCYSDLSKRWGIGKATISRMFKKLQSNGYLTCLNFSGSQGTVIYLNNYLSVMFNICDVPVDKEEVAFTLKLRINLEEKEQIHPSKRLVPISPKAVPKETVQILVAKMLETLSQSGFTCVDFSRQNTKLYPLSNASGGWILEITCGKKKKSATKYRFVVQVLTEDG